MPSPVDDHLVGILNRVQGWTTAADQKISIIVAVQTLVCGFLFPELRDWINREYTSTCIKVSLLVAGGLLAAGVGYSLRGLFPDVGPSAKSATFFGSIQSWSLSEYSNRLVTMDADPDAWRADYLSQIHVNSKITMRKFRRAQRSVQFSVAGLVVVGVCYIGSLLGF